MVNTPLTNAALLASAPDNTSGLVTPQNMRNFMVSVTGANGAGSCQALAFAPSGYAFSTSPTASPATLSSYFSTLANAQTVYPFATSLSNYVDRCMVQAALNACTALGGGTITLPPNPVYFDATVTWDGSRTTLAGTNGGLQIKTTIYTQTCGASVATSINGDGIGFFNGNVPLMNVDFCAYNTGAVSAPNNTGGTAATTFLTGSSALNINSGFFGIFSGLGFYNYDTVHTWTVGNVWEITFYNCQYNSCNNGPNITTPITNSFEGMRWFGGGANNCNIGANFNLGAGSGGSVYLTSFWLDYNIVWQVYYDSLGGGNDTQWPLVISNCHVETSSNTSGTTSCRMYNNGQLFLNGTNFTEQGSYPVGFVQQSFYGRTMANNNNLAGQGPGGTYVPLVYTTGNGARWWPTGSGNSQRYGGDCMLLQSSVGCLMAGGMDFGTTGGAGNTQFQNVSYTLSYWNQQYTQLLTSGVSVTIAPDSTFNHMNGVIISFVSLTSAASTLVAGSGVTITGNTALGGAAGKRSYIVKTAANTWLGYN